MKQFLRLILPIIGRAGIFKYLFLGLITGLCGFLFINSMTRIIGMMIADNFTSVRREYIIIFVAIILVYIWSRRALSLTSMDLSLRVAWNLRKQLLALVLNSNYWQVAKRIPRIQTAILGDVGALTNASLSAIDFCIAVIMAVSCFVYLSTISLVLFSITLVIASAGITIYYVSTKRNMKNLERSRKLETVFHTNLNSVLNGFKEIYMDSRKGDFIYNRKICINANDSFKHSVWAVTGFINNQMTGQVLFYMLVSSVLLLFSVVLNIKPANIVSFIFTLLYLQGALETIMAQLSGLARAKVAADQLMNLRKELEDMSVQKVVSGKRCFDNSFEQLAVKDLEFGYGDDEASFSIGPLSFDIKKGETIFVYGGNGSGKTTFIYTLLGLCLPGSGRISVNNVLVDQKNYDEYKTLFAVIFSNFYLFNEILTTEEADHDKWQFYIDLFELEDKVTLKNNILSTTDLSTGQRKRLALVVALLEKKPILILDEWAADQDPHFRKKFYTMILPLLNQEGFTIIAITHDDKYYHCASKLYRMIDGKIAQEDLNLYRESLPIN